MPLQGVQTTPTAYFPYASPPISTPQESQLPISTQADPQRNLILFQNLHALPAGQIPDACSPVGASRNRQLPIGAQAHCGHCTGMPFQDVQAAPTGQIP